MSGLKIGISVATTMGVGNASTCAWGAYWSIKRENNVCETEIKKENIQRVNTDAERLLSAARRKQRRRLHP